MIEAKDAMYAAKDALEEAIEAQKDAYESLKHHEISHDEFVECMDEVEDRKAEWINAKAIFNEKRDAYNAMKAAYGRNEKDLTNN